MTSADRAPLSRVRRGNPRHGATYLDERNGNDSPATRHGRPGLRNAHSISAGTSPLNAPLLEQVLTSQPLPADVRLTPGDLGGIPVIFIDIADVEPRGTIFHIHGGGFALGSAGGSVGLASSLARKTGMRAVSVEYRLAPEYPYPAALQDVTAAYRALVEQAGGADHIVVSGESAGGNLAIELLIAG
jgi:epsilon-lactone hydrolase